MQRVTFLIYYILTSFTFLDEAFSPEITKNLTLSRLFFKFWARVGTHRRNIWLYLVFFDWIWLCLVRFDCIQLYFIWFGWIWLYLVVFYCFFLYLIVLTWVMVRIGIHQRNMLLDFVVFGFILCYMLLYAAACCIWLQSCGWWWG